VSAEAFSVIPAEPKARAAFRTRSVEQIYGGKAGQKATI
jgi:hypothetical protein